MKTTNLIILCSLFSITSFSQTVYQVDELRIYSWDDTAMPPDWQHNITQQFTYENGGNKETKLLALSIPGMENIYQNIKSYNENNDIILDKLQIWDSGIPDWITQSQIVYTYISNNLKEETTQIYNPFTMLFDDSSRIVYDYLGSDAIKQTDQIWDGANWENVEKADITYTSGLPTFAEYSLWDDINSVWFPPYEQDTATYSGGLLMQVVTENFDTGDLDRSVYTYTDELLDMVVFEEWDGANWVPFDRELSSYDANGNNTVLIYEDNSTGPWVGYFKQEKDFSVAAPLSTESFETSNFKIYPNPVNDILYLESASQLSNAANASVYGMDGRLIKAMDLKTDQNNFEIDFQSLGKGLYILDIKGKNDERKTIKIIKK